MAEATAVLVLEARDRATAQLKAFGGAVQDAGQKADKAAAGVARAGVATGGMIDRMKAAQAPLRNISAILSGFGLSFLGVSAATMALRGLVNAAIQNQQAILAAQINMRRWGLTVDDTRRLVDVFRTTLGRTSGTTLAAFTDDMARFLLSFGPEGRENILRWAKQIEMASGGLIKADDTVKALMEDFELLGADKALQNLKERAGHAAASMGAVGVSVERAKGNLNALGEAIAGAVVLFDAESWKDAGKFLIAPFLALGRFLDDSDAWLKVKLDGALRKGLDLAKAWAVDWYADMVQPFVWLGAVVPTLTQSLIARVAALWTDFLAFWLGLGKALIDVAIAQWTRFGEWWTGFVSGLGDFWAGVWNGMRVVALGVYNWIVDRLNDAIAFVNSAIRAINATMGKVGLRIPEIGLQFQRGTLGAPISAPATRTFSAPVMATPGPATIIIPVTIGERTIAEIIIDTLTGAVRQRELGGEG